MLRAETILTATGWATKMHGAGFAVAQSREQAEALTAAINRYDASVVLPPALQGRPARCGTWRDHQFDGGRVTASGRHPDKGGFVRRVTRCALCGYEITETEWTSLPAVPMPLAHKEAE